MVTAPAAAPPLVGVKKVVPVELLESVKVTGPPVLATGLPKLSWTWTTKGPTVAVLPTVWLPDTVVVKTSLLGGPAVTVNEFVVADGHGAGGRVGGRDGVGPRCGHLEPVEGGHAGSGRHRGRPGREAPRGQGHVDVVGRAGAAGHRVAELVLTLTPTLKLVPAATETGGWVVMASLFSAPATMVKPFVVPLTMTVLTVAEAEIVGAPALVSE